MLQVILNFGIAFAERERERRERERERVLQWISFIILLINTFTWNYMEGTAFVISVGKTILTPTLRSINIFF